MVRKKICKLALPPTFMFNLKTPLYAEFLDGS